MLKTNSNDLFSLQSAFELSLKEAIRQLGRSISKNKPDRMIGKLALTKFPRISIEGGMWKVEVDTRIKIEVIEPYANF
jgi:hypothetical protein